LTEPRKEDLLARWREIAGRVALDIRCGERVEAIEKRGDGFEVATNQGRHRARAVVLAIGRRGTPRRLGVPGEELAKVVYALDDPAQYRGARVLVVGGGDSAIEAACEISESGARSTILCHRSDGFPRARAANRARLEALQAAGGVEVLLRAAPIEILERGVSLDVAGAKRVIENDAVVVCIGGTLPTELLTKLGVQIDVKYGDPLRAVERP
jgi:thioredoxin reductase